MTHGRRRSASADEGPVRSLLKLAVAVAVPLGVAALSGVATARSVRTWYPSLAKPTFNPPDWIFGPVWTALYVTMGVAAYLVWRQGLDSARARQALAAFAVQLVLNGAWSILFFGLRSPGMAMAEIVVLWVAISVTCWLFWRVVPAAGALLLPYLGWVTFAAVLNVSIWSLNR